MSEKHLEAAVMNRESSKKARMESTASDHSYKERMPNTWRMFHTENDNAESLTPESFRVMANILHVLASTKTLV